VHYAIRALNVANAIDFERKISNYVQDFMAPWGVLYCVDNIFDILQKKYLPGYERFVLNLKDI
jgi:hypothetical protein